MKTVILFLLMSYLTNAQTSFYMETSIAEASPKEMKSYIIYASKLYDKYQHQLNFVSKLDMVIFMCHQTNYGSTGNSGDVFNGTNKRMKISTSLEVFLDNTEMLLNIDGRDYLYHLNNIKDWFDEDQFMMLFNYREYNSSTYAVPFD